MKTALAAAALIVLALTGCASADGYGLDNARVGGGSSDGESGLPAESATPEPIATNADAPMGSGEVCDPHNLNDAICLAFYPDAGVVNMTSGARAQEPLRSMSAAAKIALAQEACDAYEAGGSAATSSLVATTLDADAAAAQIPADINNTNIFMIASLAYCNEYYAEPSEGSSVLWTLNTYRDMGEKAALASFADHTVIQRP